MKKTKAEFVLEAFRMLVESPIREPKITTERLKKLASVIQRLDTNERSKLRIETCAHGGRNANRYGNAKKRKGKAVKIGHYGRHSNQPEQQIWAVWS